MSAIKNVLFVAAGNSACSLMAEALLNTKGRGAFNAFSAGLSAGTLINPFALEIIRDLGYGRQQLRAKHWNEFVTDDAPRLDFVITLCDASANMEHHSVWPGKPIIAKWNIYDPPGALGSVAGKRSTFQKSLAQLTARIDLLLSFPHAHFDRDVIEQELNGFDLLCKDPA